MSDDLPDISLIQLTKENEEIIRKNPSIFSSLYKDTTQALFINNWPLIMAVQAAKALNGDTTSAKFITDLIQATIQLNEGKEQDVAEWESLAIELRNRLNLEISAENLVKLLIKKLLDSPLSDIEYLFL